MNIFKFFEEEFKSIIHDMKSAGDLPADLDTSRVVFELPREASHGDLACNAAMVLAKAADMKPRDLAEAFSVKIGEIAGEIAGETGETGETGEAGEAGLTVVPWSRVASEIVADLFPAHTHRDRRSWFHQYSRRAATVGAGDRRCHRCRNGLRPE